MSPVSHKIRSFFVENAFKPGITGMFINPFYIAREGLYSNIREFAPKISGRVLDVGCGTKPYRHLFPAADYIGLEVARPESTNKRADFYYDGKIFPFGDSSFDGVMVSQVIEHVFEPGEFLREINRILRINGHLLLTAPFVWDEHEQPFDFARYSSFGLKHLLEAHGFAILASRKSVSDIRVIAQLANCYFYKILRPLPVWIRLPVTLAFTAPVNLAGYVLHRMLPKNSDLYMDNVILAAKVRSNMSSPLGAETRHE